MISYFTGVPGSGKSYFAVDTLYNNFSKDSQKSKKFKKKYEYCYTNINGLKYELLNNVYRFDFDVFYKCLERLHKHYKAKKDDNYLQKLTRRYKLNNTLFILDEAHNFFDTRNPVLVWWFTYHRHLYHDLMLITQSMSLVELKYKPLAEEFYKATPKSLSFNPFNFTYKMYVESRMSKISYGGKVTIKKRKEVFALYQSGDSVETKNLIFKFILIAVLVFGSLGFLISYITNKSAPKTSNVSKVEKSITKTKNTMTQKIIEDESEEEPQDDLPYSEKKFLKVSCGISDCSADNVSFPPQLMRYFIDEKKIQILYKNRINSTNVDYYLNMSLEFYEYISNKKGDSTNEDNLNITDSIMPPPSS